MPSNSSPLRIKFIGKVNNNIWLRQLPNKDNVINNCQFIFDKNETVYDWLVVYDDLPPTSDERFPVSFEQLQCSPENTLLITIEPPTIKYYGKPYTNQFGHILTSQPPNALPHNNRIYNQAGLYWFYGVGKNHLKTHQEILAKEPANKTKKISVVWSNKKQRHTSLYQRNYFLKRIKEEIIGIDIFGKDHLPLDDKSEALDPYEYHIAIENYRGEHHWTEKISDTFLGGTLPFYFGCPNLSDYFPEQSFIPINIFNVDEAITIIKKSINDNEFQKRKDFIAKSRELILNEYNLFILLSKLIEKRHSTTNNKPSVKILSRRAANRKNIFSALNYQLHKNFQRTSQSLKNYIRPK